jgi:hypothetical protein
VVEHFVSDVPGEKEWMIAITIDKVEIVRNVDAKVVIDSEKQPNN